MFRLSFPILLTSAALTCGPALAQSGAPPKAPPPAASARPEIKALSADEMAAVNGGTEVKVDVLDNQQLTGTTTGNTINAGSLTTGQVTFSPNALNGFNGIANFVVNTGANNTLQGAINVSIVTAPPPQ